MRIFSTKYRWSLPAILLIALATRLLVTVFLPIKFSDDIDSFVRVGNLVIAGQSDYPSVYFPFIFYLGAMAVKLSNFVHPYLFLKIIFSLFDVGIVYLIFRLTNDRIKALFYALNPISLIVINVHGQMDSIPLFFLILVLLLLKKQQEMSAGLMLSLAIFIKPWPLIFAPWLVFRSQRKLTLSLAIISVPLLSMLLHAAFFGTSPQEVWQTVVHYRGVQGFWGIGEILTKLLNAWPSALLLMRRIGFRIFLVGLIIFSLIKRRNSLTEIWGILLFFFSFTIGFGAQWLLWLVPFLVIIQPKNWKILLTIMTIYLGITFAGDVFSIPQETTTYILLSVSALGFIIWGMIIGMLLG